MGKIIKLIVVIVALGGSLCFISAVDAEIYNIERITHIVAENDGAVLIKWANSPRPGPCATGNETNHGWVEIPSAAPKEQKALAMAIYISGKPARIDTSGCHNTREIVVSIYSPGG